MKNTDTNINRQLLQKYLLKKTKAKTNKENKKYI